MSSTFTSENLQKTFKFPFKDEKWKSKFLVGGLLVFASILVFPAFFVAGYVHEIMRRIIVDKSEPSLPEWDDMGTYFKNGFKVWSVNLIFSSPAILLMVPYFVYFLSLPFLMDASGEINTISAMGFPITLGLLMLGSLLSMVLSFFSITAIGHMAAKGEFSAAFRIREWWPIFRENFGGFFLAFIIIMGASWLAMFVFQILMITIIFCFIFPFAIAAFYVYFGAIAGAFFAQAYNEGVEKVAATDMLQ